MISTLSPFLPSFSLLNDTHFPRTVSVLEFFVRFVAYQEKLFSDFYLMALFNAVMHAAFILFLPRR